MRRLAIAALLLIPPPAFAGPAAAGLHPVPIRAASVASTARSEMDVDGDGQFDALTDGLLIMRYMFGLRGQPLIQGAISAGAVRKTAEEIEAYLAYQPAQPPADCRITQAPDTTKAPVVPNAPVLLTPWCMIGSIPITYTWDISGVAPYITVTPATTTSYALTPSNAHGGAGSVSTTVHVGPAGTAPGNCAITQTPNTGVAAVAPGVTVNLSLACGTGSPVTSCAWSGVVPATTACSVDITAPSVTTPYSVIPSNTYGNPGSIGTTVAVQPASTNYCTGADQIINLTWPPGGGLVKTTIGNFGTQRVAFRITVPASLGVNYNVNNIGYVHLIEVPGTAVVARDMTVSKHSCDFTSGHYLFNEIGYSDTAPGANFSVNNPQSFGDFNLNFGDVVYVNVRNALSSGLPSCPFTTCNAFLDFATPDR